MKKIVKIVSVLCALVFCAAAVCACKDKKYLKYDSTGERYDYYLPDYVKVCKYKGLELPDLTHTPTEADIDKRVKQMVAAFCPRTEDPDRACIEGDVVDIGATCTFEDDGSTYSLLSFKTNEETGSGQAFVLGTDFFYFPALDEAVEGMLSGEDKTVTLTLPDPYYKDLVNSGRKIKMDIHLNYIDEVDYSVVDDEFYVDRLEYSKDNFRVAMTNKLTAEYAELIEDYKTKLAWNIICANSELIKVPEKEYNELYESALDSARGEAQSEDISLAEYAEKLGYDTLDDYYAYLKEKCENTCFEDMILYYIIRCEDLNYTDEYYSEQVLAMVKDYQIEDQSAAEDFLNYYYGIDNVKEEIRMKYAQKWVADNAKVREDVKTVYDNDLNPGMKSARDYIVH